MRVSDPEQLIPYFYNHLLECDLTFTYFFPEKDSFLVNNHGRIYRISIEEVMEEE